MQRRVVITGMGAVTALGLGADTLWQAARDGHSGVKSIEFSRGDPLRIKIAAHFPEFDAASVLGRSVIASTDRFSAFALVAADEACKQAGVLSGAADERCGVIVGSGIGGVGTVEDGCYMFYVSKGRADPMTIPKVMPNAAASHISMRYGAKGPSFCVSSACSSAAQAIGLGLFLIRAGLIDRAIVGGAEALLSPAVFRAWEVLRVLTPTASRPFSQSRDGMVLGEGAGILVIEALECAEKRGVPIIAELAGYGTTSDAGDLLRPDPQGAQRAMNLAIADAGLTPKEIGYVNAHGTATVLNDITETQALAGVFGGDLKQTAVSSTKPIHGHTLGAAGAIELIISIKALLDQIAPPTINWLGPDPKCDLDPVPGHSRPIETTAALSNSFAFGGINASLVVRRFT